MPGPLGFVVILAPALVLATGALLCLILGLFYVIYLQPFLDWLTRRGGGFLGRLIKWTTRPLTGYVKAFINRHVELLMRSFTTGIPPLVTMVNQLQEVMQRTYGTLDDMSEQILQAFRVLRLETIPREISEAVTPIRNTVERHTDRLFTLEGLNQQIAVIIGNGLRALPWGVPGTLVGNFDAWWDTYRHLWGQVFTSIMPRLNELYGTTVPQLQTRVTQLAQQVEEISRGTPSGLGKRLTDLERLVERTIQPQIQTLTQSVDTLFELVTGITGPTLTRLFERVATLEAQMADLIGTTTQTLLQRLTALETALREDVETRLRQLELQTELLMERAFGEITADLSALVGRIVAIEQEIETVVLPKLQTLEGLLAPAAFAAAVALAMRTIAPNLFCRNVTSVTQRVCGLDENQLAQLLAGTMVFALALDPRLIARAGQEVTEGMAALWRETALR